MSKYDRYLIPSNDPRLCRVSERVQPGANITDIAELMEAVCKKGSVRGSGLAAPQIGHSIRLIYSVCYNDRGEFRGVFMVNPEIIWADHETNVDTETSLSHPGISKRIRRPNTLRVRYETLNSRQTIEKLIDVKYWARVIQHQIDYLDGVCKAGDSTYLEDGPDRIGNVRAKASLAAATALACYV